MKTNKSLFAKAGQNLACKHNFRKQANSSAYFHGKADQPAAAILLEPNRGKKRFYAS